MSSLSEELSWQNLRACAGMDTNVFFPERGGSARIAKMICNGNGNPALGPTRLPCPVREQCLRYALSNREQYGVWGGVAERDRRGMAVNLGIEQSEWRSRKAS